MNVVCGGTGDRGCKKKLTLDYKVHLSNPYCRMCYHKAALAPGGIHTIPLYFAVLYCTALHCTVLCYTVTTFLSPTSLTFFFSFSSKFFTYFASLFIIRLRLLSFKPSRSNRQSTSSHYLTIVSL